MSYYLMLGVEVTLLFGQTRTLLMVRNCLAGLAGLQDFQLWNLADVSRKVWETKQQSLLDTENTPAISLVVSVCCIALCPGRRYKSLGVFFWKQVATVSVQSFFSYSWMTLAKCTWKCVMICHVQCPVLLPNGATGRAETLLHVTGSMFVLVFGGVFPLPGLFWQTDMKSSAGSVKQWNVARHLVCHATQIHNIVLKSKIMPFLSNLFQPEITQ